jgi:chemotaxis signal transduction protein
MRTQTQTDPGTRGALTFPVGDFWFAVRVEEAGGLIDAEMLAPLPGQSGPLAGVVAFRGEMVAVIDLAAFLGIETSSQSARGYALVLARGADRFGILIPELPRLVPGHDLREAAVATGDVELGELIESVLQSGSRQFHCLNYWRIFETIIPPAVAANASRESSERGS